jgi:hypothetical protein
MAEDPMLKEEECLTMKSVEHWLEIGQSQLQVIDNRFSFANCKINGISVVFVS